MSIDKEFRPIEAAMIKSIFTEIIRKVLHVRIQLEISFLWANLKPKEGIISSIGAERAAKINYLREDKAKNHLKQRLEVVQKQKVDLIAEILKQYEMEKGNFGTFDHDIMTQIFDKEAQQVKKIIEAGDYKKLYDK